VYLSARQDDVRTMDFSTIMTMSTLSSATLALRGYHLHVILVGFYSSHNTRVMTVGGVIVYLIGYIFCIIDCRIYQNIFDMIDIMYCRLSYVSGCDLPLKTLILYIYGPRDTMRHTSLSLPCIFTMRSKCRQ
jgi:hypothetical protein